MALIKRILSLILLTLTPFAATAETWQEAITERIAYESKLAKSVWTKALEEGVTDNNGLGRDGRRIFTLIQKTVESEISKSLKNGTIKSAIMIIHSPKPATPLCIGTNPGDLTINKLDASPKSKEIVRQRRKALLNHLQQGGTIISVYQQNTKAPKSKVPPVYYSLVEKYKPLLDKPIKSVPDRYWGATYLVRQLDDSVFAFSISAEQANLIGKKTEEPTNPWHIWFGPLLNTEVSKRIVQIESFLKSEGIDIYTYLGLNNTNQ